jgi:hypothetical protein
MGTCGLALVVPVRRSQGFADYDEVTGELLKTVDVVTGGGAKLDGGTALLFDLGIVPDGYY